MFMIDYKEISWWYWFAITCLLSAGLAGWPFGFFLAIGVGLFQLIHFSFQEASISSFPVQVRFFYLLFLLLISTLPETAQMIVYWLPTVGTWATVIFGFCGMARLVSLLPWNRSEPLSLDLLKRTILSRPMRYNIRQGLPPPR